MFTEEQLRAIKEKHPGADLRQFTNQEFDVDWVIRVPGDIEFAAWRMQQSASGDDFHPVNREFVVRCVVAPDSTEVRTKLANSAGLVEAFLKYIVRLLGTKAEFTVKKL
jgi:hypothetical protein